METLADVIGKNIKERREALGLSQNKLASVACIGNNASVSRWEDGTFCPRCARADAVKPGVWLHD